MASDGLDQLLRELASQGQRESSGSFSLNLLSSHQRLSQSLLESPQAWLTKVLQAAIALGPSEVHVVQRPLDLQISFALPAEDSTLDELPAAFLAPLEARWPRALRHLALGLHAAYGQSMEYVACLRFGRRGQPQAFLVGPDRLEPLPMELTGPEASCHIRVRKRPAGGWFGRRDGAIRLRELQALDQLGFSACPIYLDGYRRPPQRLSFPPPRQALLDFYPPYQGFVDRALVAREPLASLVAAPHPSTRPAACYDFGHGIQDQGLRGTVMLSQWRVPPRDQPHFPTGPPLMLTILQDQRIFWGSPPGDFKLGTFRGRRHDSGSSTLFCDSAGLTLAEDRLPCHAFLSLPCPGSRTQGCLQLVHDGLSLRPLEVDLGFPGAFALVCAPRVQTDLSQVTPVEDAYLQDLVTCLRDQVQQMLADARTLVRFGARIQVPGSQLKALSALLGLDRV